MTLHLGDCLPWLRSLPDCSVDAVVTDPPYGLGRPPPVRDVLRAWLAGESYVVSGGGFMGRSWDAFVPGPDVWTEVARVLKPGGHIVCFAGQRTVDWMGLSLRLGGLEARDLLGWVYYTGFPKSLDVSKAIDRAAGVERVVVRFDYEWIRRVGRNPGNSITYTQLAFGNAGPNGGKITAPATDAARQWNGWGTALKPALEPAILARKPLAGTVAENVLEWGTGALNIDGCRHPPGDAAWVGPDDGAFTANHGEQGTSEPSSYALGARLPMQTNGQQIGRWPSNTYACAKASRAERERGAEGLPRRNEAIEYHGEGRAGLDSPRAGAGRTADGLGNHHPTVKPVRLMRFLCRLLSRPGGVVLDPFAGSGTTGIAAALEGMAFLGAEREPDYHRLALARIEHARRHPEAWADTAPGVRVEAHAEGAELESAGQVSLFGGRRD